MKKKVTLSLLSLCLLSTFLTSCNNSKQEFKTLNSQSGVIVGNKNYNNSVLLNGKSIEPYLSYSQNIKLRFDTYHLDSSFSNKIIINDIYEYDLVPSNNSFETYYTTDIDLLGLNIIDGKIKIKFVAGSDKTNLSLDTFYVRNVVLIVNENEIWSNEYEKNNYLNEKIGLGESTINSDFRFGIIPERVFTFNVDESILDCKGYLLKEADYQDTISLNVNNKETTYDNPRMSYSVNLENNEVIEEDRIIDLTVNNTSDVKTYLDGIEVNLPLKLTSSCWVKGIHTLKVVLKDGNHRIENEYQFELKDFGEPTGSSTHKVYNNGVSNNLPMGIDNLGVETTLTNQIVTPFGEMPYINFEITNNESKNIVWKGKVNQNRTAFLQLYNYVEQRFDTVATNKASSSEEEIVLATNYDGLNEYVYNNKTVARVATKMNQEQFDEPSGLIQHLSDVQYIVEKSAAQGDSILGKEAKDALTSMNEYVIESKPDYSLITGDLVQGTVDEKEWKDIISYLIDPILEANVPLGVSSGNHDVGGINAVNVNGSNGLDDALVYDYYTKYVGSDKFSKFSYYGESFENNRSHYDLVNIAGHDFMFLHLGWGSSTYGVHVSSKDVEWAKSVLNKHKDKTVVLSTHEYLNSQGIRNITGEYVFNSLVKEYKNIKFVFSGHVNGSAMKIDVLDDNNDGLDDRRVLQLLTDYQEEENLYGATFIRNISLFAKYNNILFDIYSPFYCDDDIIVFSNPDIIKQTDRFEYAFDVSNDGFGIVTHEFK